MLKILLLLESLSPTERAAFLLRQVFEYDYPEIARMVGKSEANCRQMVHRARQRLAERRPRYEADPARAEAAARRFLAACERGELAGLMEVLAADATAYADGNGLAGTARRPVQGAGQVARYLLGLAKRGGAGAVFRVVRVGGELGVVTYLHGQPVAVTTFAVADDRIQEVFLVVSPEKLAKVPALH